MDQGGRLAYLSPETVGRLDKALPHLAAHNPVDIMGDTTGNATPRRWMWSCRTKASMASSSSTVRPRSHRPNRAGRGPGNRQAQATAPTDQLTRRPCRPGGKALVRRAGNSDLRHARRGGWRLHADGHLSRIRERWCNATSLSEELEGGPRQMRRSSRGRWLRSELAYRVEGPGILAAYGVPVAPTRLAGSPQEAAALAAEIDGPVALKIVSPGHSAQVRHWRGRPRSGRPLTC